MDVEEALLLDVNGECVGRPRRAHLLRGKIILPVTAVKLGSRVQRL